MKTLWSLMPIAIKPIVQIIVFIMSLGWASYGAILLIVKAEGQSIRKEALTIRGIDKGHFDDKINGVEHRMNGRFDKIERLIKEQ